MLTLKNSSVMNLDNAMRGARNPLNSWDRSDSKYLTWEEGAKDVYPEFLKSPDPNAKYFVLGENDLGLAVRLRQAGGDHRKYLRQIFISVDVTAPMYWWKEADTYKVGTVANSTSTMHKIHSKPITMEDFSCEDVTPSRYKAMGLYVSQIESARLQYMEEKDPVLKKTYWRDIIQMLPSSYNQMRTWTFNYENLVGLYKNRKIIN